MHPAGLVPQAVSTLSEKLECYYRSVRVRDWLGYLMVSVFGYCLGAGLVPYRIDYVEFLTLLAASSLFLAFAFLINNCYDVLADINQSAKLAKNPIASGKMSQEEGITLSVGLAAVGLLVAFSSLGLLSKLVYLFLMIWGGMYSVPPFRLKGVPVVDVISHGLAFGSGPFLYGFLVASGGSMTMQAGLVASSLFLYSMILELKNHLYDLEADFLSNTNTTVCWLGKERSEQILSLLMNAHVLFLCAVACFIFRSSLLILPNILIGTFIILYPKDIERKLTLISVLVYGTLAVSHVLLLL
jgi:4-hydroxybenzoate polyprenyltransferase